MSAYDNSFSVGALFGGRPEDRGSSSNLPAVVKPATNALRNQGEDEALTPSVWEFVKKYGPGTIGVVGDVIEVFGKTPRGRAVGVGLELLGGYLKDSVGEKVVKASEDKEAKTLFPIDANGRAILAIPDLSAAQKKWISDNVPELLEARPAMDQARLAAYMAGASLLNLFRMIPIVDSATGKYVRNRTVEEAIVLIKAIRAVVSDPGMTAVLEAYATDVVHHRVHGNG